MSPRASIVILAAGMLLALAACAPNSVVQVNPPESSTPSPGGQIDVPGVSIQLYVPGPNPLINTGDAHGRPAGFWLGIWHGVISPLTLLASFVSKQNVQMYEVHNIGSLYNLGFFLGILVAPGVLGAILGSRR